MDHVAHVFGTFPCQFRYVQENFVSGSVCIFNHCSKIEHLDYPNFVNASYFRFKSKGIDFGQYGIDTFLAGSQNFNNTLFGYWIFVDNDSSLGRFLKLLYNFSAWSDQAANIFVGDGNGNHFWGVWFYIGIWLRNGVGQFFQNVQSSCGSLFKGFHENFIRKSLYLDVHLASGNPIFGTGYFKVHVPKMILVAKNIGKNRIFSRFPIGNQSHGNTGNRFFYFYSRIHQGHGSCTNSSHG